MADAMQAGATPRTWQGDPTRGDDWTVTAWDREGRPVHHAEHLASRREAAELAQRLINRGDVNRVAASPGKGR